MALSYVKETALFYIEGVHRPPVNWNHDEFVIHAQIYHGTRPLRGMQSTHFLPIDTTGFYPRIIFEAWYVYFYGNLYKIIPWLRLSFNALEQM